MNVHNSPFSSSADCKTSKDSAADNERTGKSRKNEVTLPNTLPSWCRRHHGKELSPQERLESLGDQDQD